MIQRFHAYKAAEVFKVLAEAVEVARSLEEARSDSANRRPLG
jgi:hypothetical protein